MSVLSVFVVSCRRRFHRQHQALAIAVALLTTTSVVAAVGHHRRGVPSVLRQTGDDRVGEDGATQPGTTADGDRYAGELAPLGDASGGTRRHGAPSPGPAPAATGDGRGPHN